MKFDKDPIGYAIRDFVANGFTENITVECPLFDDDILPVEYLFRETELMPEIEQHALSLCKGEVLDVGAAAGCHAYALKEKGINCISIDTSEGAVAHLKEMGFNAQHKNFFKCNKKYDTLLILMNGVGIAGTLEKLPDFLAQIKNSLKPEGIALCDSTDLSYIYKEDDGSMWVDLNGSYYGELKFKMTYKEVSTDWFDWLYIDFDLLKSYAEEAGLNCELTKEGPNHNYLVTLTHLL